LGAENRQSRTITTAENKTNRGRELVVYLVVDGQEQRALLCKLGKHKMGKACLYFKQLADLDESVLETLVVDSVAGVSPRYE
jgi:hypothetical protein